MRVCGLLVLLLPLALSGQEKKPNFGVFADYTSIEGFRPKPAAGINIEVPVNDYVGFRTTVAGFEHYGYFNGVALLAPLFLVAGKEKDAWKEGIRAIEVLIWLCLIESPSFHIPLGRNSDLAPYLNLCRVRYIWDNGRTASTTWFASWVAGISLSQNITKTVFVRAHAERTQLYYAGTPSGWQAGIGVHFLMN